ncbi:Zc3h12a-like ribonuclease NYN domain containing protein [Nitzschia inconspicua]|uniref:Zc3h12a-like ribonuclease NYN domain containing protein n=1 Tax=Nitzschia inconspicua TaxID=303405 RepID=A0A9K3Q009_9STRA|nr:Zc3h12a-like ribonuclease NYN domain containing protein [Nitzschia inconspicua]
MSGRPRLVEEGEPIAFAKDPDDSAKNTASLVEFVHHPSQMPRNKRSSLGNSGGGGGSSLQQAAGISIFPKRRSKGGGVSAVKTETSFVIGGETESKSNFTSSHQVASPSSSCNAIGGNNPGHAMYLEPLSANRYPSPPHWEPSSDLYTKETSTTIVGPETWHNHGPSHHHHLAQHYTVSSSHTLPPTNSSHHQNQSFIHQNDHFLDDHDMEGDFEIHNDRQPPIEQHVHHAPNIYPEAVAVSNISSQASNATSTYAYTARIPTQTQTSYEVGGSNDAIHTPSIDSRPLERMEGVEDLGIKMPLVVLDGANVAHHYAQAMAGLDRSSLSVGKTCKPEPDAQGIQVATDHFVQAGLRVLVVLPQYWFKAKPRTGDNSLDSNALMETPQLEILNDLKSKGLIVASPPTDDDDAYALTIARREEMRSLTKRNGEGPGFVLSNDLFRDAQNRDSTGSLRQWLKHGRHDSVGPGRISYTFGDMGTMNDRGERILDFIPNPRHPLVIWMDGLLLSHP